MAGSTKGKKEKGQRQKEKMTMYIPQKPAVFLMSTDQRKHPYVNVCKHPNLYRARCSFVVVVVVLIQWILSRDNHLVNFFDKELFRIGDVYTCVNVNNSRI